MKILRHILTAMVLVVSIQASAASSPTWEDVNALPREIVAKETADSDISALGISGGYVYISVRQTSSIKIFTILGQLVTQQQLKPGTYRIKLLQRGVYLLKAGSITRRIAI